MTFLPPLPVSSLWPGTRHPDPHASRLLPPRWLACGVQVCCSVLSFPSPSKKKPHNLIEKVRKKPHISVFPPRSRPSHVPSELPAPVPPPPGMTDLSGSSINSLCPQRHFTCFSAIGLLLFAFLHPAVATLPSLTLVFSRPGPQGFFATTAPWGRGLCMRPLRPFSESAFLCPHSGSSTRPVQEENPYFREKGNIAKSTATLTTLVSHRCVVIFFVKVSSSGCGRAS